MNNFRYFLMVMIALIVATLACGTVEIGVVTPTSEDDLVNVTGAQEPTPEMSISISPEEIAQPTQEPSEDFSHLWVEYWNPVYNYGIALPSHWLVQTESEGGFMSTRSYDMDFFNAHSIKGNWMGGEAPEGAVKLDFVPLEVGFPEQTLEVAISEMFGADQDVSVLLSVEKTLIGDHEAVVVTTAQPHNLEDTTTSIAFRLSPETILLVAAFPNATLYSNDVQLILGSLVPNKNTSIIKPSTAPHPPLTVKNEELTGMSTATTATAWYGHIASLPENESFEDKVVLSLDAGEYGIEGYTPEIEEKIRSLRDATGEAEYVHLWGVLYCNVDDYNACQLNVERLEYGDQYTVASSPVEQWVGKIKSIPFHGETAYAFELSGSIPVRYGIAASIDPAIQDQIEVLANSDTLVNVWGDLLVGVQDVNGTSIEVLRIDPPGPGALPSSSACESGYLGSVEEMLEFVQYNLEIGNHWPFSYAIGNPFVIGYWRSEGVAIPREEAYQQLTENYLPSPEEVVVITDLADFPDLDGVPLENMWGPDVDVAANLYSKGWGPDGQGEAILVIARCQSGDQEAYFWYGMLYAMSGFE